MVLFVAWWIHSDRMKQISTMAKDRECNCRNAMLAGIASGLVTGLLGIGGGFIIVPLLLMLGVASCQSAIAHSLVLIISNSAVAALSYAENLQIEWHPTLLIVALAALGSWLGSHVAERYSSQNLQKAFSLILTIISSFIMYKAFTQ